MPTRKDVKEVTRGKVSEGRRFDKRDFDFIAEYVISEHQDRKGRRRDQEKHWKEVDRQLEMTPDTQFKHVIKQGGS